MSHLPEGDLQSVAFLAELITAAAANPHLSQEINQGNIVAALPALLEHIQLRNENILPWSTYSTSSPPSQPTRAQLTSSSPFCPAPFFAAAEGDDVFRPTNSPPRQPRSGSPSQPISFARPSSATQYGCDALGPWAPTYSPQENKVGIFQILDETAQDAQRGISQPNFFDSSFSPTQNAQHTAASPFTSDDTFTSPPHMHNSSPTPSTRPELSTPTTDKHNFTSHNTTPNLQSPTNFTFEPLEMPGVEFLATPTKFRKWQANDTAESMLGYINGQKGCPAKSCSWLHSGLASAGIVEDYGLLSTPMVPRLEASDEDIEAMDLTEEQLAAVREQFGYASEEGASDGAVVV